MMSAINILLVCGIYQLSPRCGRHEKLPFDKVLESASALEVYICSAVPYDPPSAVVRISAGRRVGSGFYADESLIVTNAHVVANFHSVQIAFSDRSPFPGRVVFRDADLDFAIIRPGIRGNPLPIRRGPVQLGEPIVAMGFPQGRKVIAASTGTVVDVVDCCILHDALIAGGGAVADPCSTPKTGSWV